MKTRKICINFTGRTPGNPGISAGDLTSQQQHNATEKLSDSYMIQQHPGLPTPPQPCPCSPNRDSRSPASDNNSSRSSPTPLSPGGPDDLSMSKKLLSSPNSYVTNNSINVSN